jgi:hypothetical protein
MTESRTGKRFPLRERLRYRLDNAFASGTSALMAWLALLAVVLVLGSTVVATLAGLGHEDDRSFVETFWQNLLRTLDPGTMADDVGWGLRIVSLVVTVGGVLMVSSLIGLVANAISARLLELQQGRRPVVELDHTLVLGWSAKVPTIVDELFVAAEDKGRATVVVLAPVEKERMERRLRERVRPRKGMRWVCRSGEPWERTDLELVHPSLARAVIIMGDGAGEADAGVIKTVLALLTHHSLPAQVPLVAELNDPSSVPALTEATEGRVMVVESSEIIARITAQVARQPGLSSVYLELLGFEGHECYLRPEPRLEGRTFHDALLSFDGCTVLGIVSGERKATLAPPMDTKLRAEDRLVVLAEDDSGIAFTGVRTVPPPAGRADGATAGIDSTAPENVLLVGWSPLAHRVLEDLDGYVSPGSSVVVWRDVSGSRRDEVKAVGERLRHLQLAGIEERPVRPEAAAALLDELAIDHVIILCNRVGVSEAEADAHALLTLLQVRRAVNSCGRRVNVVTELLDARDQELAPEGGADDFVISEHLTSLVMSQLAENSLLQQVFADLVDPHGVELYLKPIAAFTGPGESVTFAQMVWLAAERGEVALGYRPGGAVERKDVIVNPAQSSSWVVGPDDQLLVLAESDVISPVTGSMPRSR